MKSNVIKVETFKKCTICKKRPGTILCDMPIQGVTNLHMPKELEDTGLIQHQSFTIYYLTCDRCSTKLCYERHICKECRDKLQY